MPANQTQQNRVSAYLRPKKFELFKAYCEVEDISRSEKTEELINDFINSLPGWKLKELEQKIKQELTVLL